MIYKQMQVNIQHLKKGHRGLLFDKGKANKTSDIKLSNCMNSKSMLDVGSGGHWA